MGWLYVKTKMDLKQVFMYALEALKADRHSRQGHFSETEHDKTLSAMKDTLKNWNAKERKWVAALDRRGGGGR